MSDRQDWKEVLSAATGIPLPVVDGQEPVTIKKKPNSAKRAGARGEGGQKQLSDDTQVRFVYENELKGEWFSVKEAIHLPVYPNPDHTVVRIEFRDSKPKVSEEE